MERIPRLIQFLQDSPNDAFLQFALGLEYIKSGDPLEGLRYFEQLRSSQPDYVGTYYHLAKLYITLNRAQDAEKCYDDGIAVAKRLNDQHALAELQNAALNFKMGLSDDD